MTVEGMSGECQGLTSDSQTFRVGCQGKVSGCQRNTGRLSCVNVLGAIRLLNHTSRRITAHISRA